MTLQPNKKHSRRREGCGFFLVTCLYTCLALIINGAVVVAFYSSLAPLGPAWLSQPKVSQAVMLLGPVILVVVQWWLLDWLADYWSARQRKPPPPGQAAKRV